MDANRFALYVSELQQFSSTHQVHFGSPEDISLLLAAIEASESFREECASMLRSIVYREHGQAPSSELLMLLLVAWGGTAEPGPATALHDKVSVLRRFAAGVMKTSLCPLEDLDPAPAPHRSSAAAIAPELAVAPQPATPVLTENGTSPHAPEAAVPDNAGTELATVESALQQLVSRSPDVQLYLRLLAQRVASEPLQTTPPSLSAEPPAKDAPPPQPPASHNPWDENSELQIKLRRFAAQREARRAYEAGLASRPIHAEVADATEAAFTRILGKRRPM